MISEPTGSAGHGMPQPAVLRASLLHCDDCQRPARFLNPTRAAELAAVSRSTIYYWMRRGWVHWRVLPSRRRVICLESLSHANSLLPVEAGEDTRKAG
ncbi:MAG: hypothetical protein P4M01_00945 [Acidobacteriota bacterium]|nr:hypothetical protein [Acidobacteriota bacterium]